MAGTTPQQRTRDNLTARGYLVGTVEGRKRFPDRKKQQCRVCGHIPLIEISADLWNVFDIVAVKPSGWGSNAYDGDGNPNKPEIIFVQTTSRANHSTRRNKILASMEARLVLLSGARILIQSWRQEGARGSKWLCYDQWIGLEAFKQAVSYPDTVAQLMEIKRKAQPDDLPPSSSIKFEGIQDSEIPF